MAEHRNLIKDDVSGQKFDEISVRECKHPSVVRKYGHGGVCNVSVYTCAKCKMSVRVPFCGALTCGYEREGNQ